MKLRNTSIEISKRNLIIGSLVILIIALGLLFLIQRRQLQPNYSVTEHYKLYDKFSDNDKVRFNIRNQRTNKETSLTLEIARSSYKQQVGLMDRNELKDIDGMLFIFKYEAPLTFWMRNTLIPLDIIFLSSESIITAIHTNTKPEQTRETYSSKENAQFVIELNGGRVLDLDWKENDLLVINIVDE